MAIGFNLPNGAFRLNAQEAGGQPDYMAALQSGLKGSQMASETVMKPQSLSEALLQAQLKNAHDRTINKYLDEQQRSEISHRNSQTGLYGAQLQKALMENKQNQQFNDAFANNGRSSGSESIPTSNYDNSSNAGVSVEGPGANYGAPTAANTFPGRTGRTIAQPQTPAQQPYVGNVNEAMTGQQDNLTVLSAGDPNKEYLNQMHEQHPEWRNALKSKGYEQTSEVKYDAKTGTSSIITKYPNGKVTVQTSKPADSGYGALTSANITKANDAIMGVTNVLPTIDKLIDLADKGDIPGQMIGQYFNADKQATYNSLSNMSGDTLAKALGFPSTDKGMDAALASIRRADRESDKHYADRLKDYRKDMMERLKNSKQFLRKGVSTSDSNQSDPYKLGI